MEHDVDAPTSPTRAEHRLPSQRIPASPRSTRETGIMSRSASSSVVKRGQSREYEQQAPQAWHDKDSLFAGMATDRMEGWEAPADRTRCHPPGPVGSHAGSKAGFRRSIIG